MRSSVVAISLVAALAFSGVAQAHHKPGHHMPPGQAKRLGAPGQMEKVYNPDVVVPDEVEFVCLVTTERAGDPYSRVVFTEWLPRAEAEAEADKGRSFVIYHPDLNTEEGCVGF